MLFILLIGLAVLLLDQLSKLFITGFFIADSAPLLTGMLTVEGESVVLIPKWLSFTYVLNDGAAFGILARQRWFFLTATVLFCAVGIVILCHLPKKHITLKLSSAFLLGGALGNMIDRSLVGNVRDFIDLTLIETVTGFSFPVFNVADIFVVVGTVILAVYILFIHDKIYEPKNKEEKSDG
jgi:signal peptidase II